MRKRVARSTSVSSQCHGRDACLGNESSALTRSRSERDEGLKKTLRKRNITRTDLSGTKQKEFRNNHSSVGARGRSDQRNLFDIWITSINNIVFTHAQQHCIEHTNGSTGSEQSTHLTKGGV